MNYQRKILNHTLTAYIVVNLILVPLLFLKPVLGRNLVLTLGAAVFIIATIILSKIENLDAAALGVRTDSLKRDIAYMFISILLIFPFFLVASHFYQTLFLKHQFQLYLRDNIIQNAVTNLLVAAIPEEIFFRGYMQGQLRRVYGFRSVIRPVSLANLITSVLFALGHFFINPRPDRLAVFFPSLLFGILRERRGNIYPSVFLHWISNVIMYILLGMYR